MNPREEPIRDEPIRDSREEPRDSREEPRDSKEQPRGEVNKLHLFIYYPPSLSMSV